MNKKSKERLRFVLHQLVERFEITDVHLHKLVVRLVLDILQVRQVSSVCQLVQTDDIIFRVLVHEQSYHVAADESGTAGNYYIFHEL